MVRGWRGWMLDGGEEGKRRGRKKKGKRKSE